jgi:hypothetical protein
VNTIIIATMWFTTIIGIVADDRQQTARLLACLLDLFDLICVVWCGMAHLYFRLLLADP